MSKGKRRKAPGRTVVKRARKGDRVELSRPVPKVESEFETGDWVIYKSNKCPVLHVTAAGFLLLEFQRGNSDQYRQELINPKKVKMARKAAKK